MTKWFLNGRKILVLLFIPLSIILGLFSWKYLLSSDDLVVVKVIDGDTIKLSDGRAVRYINVDTPELEACFGEEAKVINEKLVAGKTVRLEKDTNEMDRFGRLLAYVYVKDNSGEEVFVNQYLLEEGAGEFFLDTVNLQYQDVLVEAAQRAHDKSKGLWQACASDPAVGCQIKGNLDRLDKRWYHLPSFRHYDQVVINLEDSDRWFCSEEEAQAAGFKRSRE